MRRFHPEPLAVRARRRVLAPPQGSRPDRTCRGERHRDRAPQPDHAGTASRTGSAAGAGVADAVRCALKRRRSSALPTTLMLEKTIARLAMTGFRSPIAASGMAARL